MAEFSPSDMAAVVDTATRLQIDPQSLAAVLHYESGFNPRSAGPSGKGYPVRGLIGFDPENIRRYGEPAPTIAGQMPQVEQYLLDRGWKPGQFAPNDLGRLYSIINAGGLDKNDQPHWNRRDINGSIAQHVERIRRGSMGPGQQFLSQLDPMAAIDAALSAPKPQPAPAGDVGKLFRDAGFDVPAVSKSAPAPSAGGAGAPAGKAKSIFEEAGFTLPAGKPQATPAPENAPPGAVHYLDMPGIGGRRYIDANGNFITPPNPPEEPRFVPGAASAAVGGAIGEAFSSSAEQAKHGWAGVLTGQPASGLGNAAMGGLGMLSSPVTGLVNALVRDPVTEFTGNPEIGERAGFVAGAVPMLGGGRAVAKAASPANRAVNALVDAIGPENVPEAAARLRTNPQMSLVDVSDPVRTMTQGLAADPAQPEAQRAVQEAARQRAAEAPAQVNSAYTQLMGPAPDVVKLVDQLKERARAIGRKEIQPALANAKPVDVSPVIQAIDAELKPGITALANPATRLPLSDLQQELLRFRQQLTDSASVRSNAGQLHEIQSKMGDMAYQLSRSSDAKQRMLGSQLRGFNETLIDQIDAAAGGAYRPARAKFKDAKDIQQAWEEGFDVLKNRSGTAGLEDRPEALAEWMKTATPQQILAKQLGTRSDIDQKIRGVRNQVLAGTGITKIEYNQEKLQTLFGKDEADRLIRSMNDAADMSRTNQKLTEGSKTAETLAGREALAVRPVGGGNPLQYALPVMAEILGEGQGLPGIGLAGVTAAKLGQMGWQKAGQLSDRARNAAFARAAMARGNEREGVLSALASHPKVIRELAKRHGALTAAPGSMGPVLGGASALLGGASTIRRLLSEGHPEALSGQ